MNEEQKKAYYDKYYKAKQKGGKFYPDVIYKDLLVAFAIFLLLVGLATFVGVTNEPKADPTDSAYVPRPEWYFLWLFEMLKYFPGELEWVGTIIIPVVLIAALLLLPLYDRNPLRHFSQRRLALAVMSAGAVAVTALTIMAAVNTPPHVEDTTIANTIPEKIAAGQELYSIHCVECHGPDGEGGEIKGVEGLEGVVVKPINSQDEMYTRSDQTLYAIIDYGQPSLGMTPFGTGYGGELGPGEMEYITTFMRYSWDDRAEVPAGTTIGLALPPLGPDETPSYEAHVSLIVKRYCISCHRPGKDNQNYLMESYAEVMQSGDNAPNVIAGDLGCNLIRMLHREEIEAGGAMPPSMPLPDTYIQIFERWVLGGAPNTAADAAALSPASPALPAATEAVTEEAATPTP
ncbi:MAG: c-type cytochrome [Anaerolineales bacterium]|nr:c-type cytochrome [Anaerolineales bacterium]